MRIIFKEGEYFLLDVFITLIEAENIKVNFKTTYADIYIYSAIFINDNTDAKDRVKEIINAHISMTTIEDVLNFNKNKISNKKIKQELNTIDLISIRSIREFISSQPNAPQSLKDLENIAASKRLELR